MRAYVRTSQGGMVFSVAAGLTLIVTVLTAGAVEDYPRYKDGCQNCHGAFTGATSPKGTVFPSNSKHEMHRSSSAMHTDCNLCHTSGDNRNPFTGSSNGTINTPGFGCAGCHGRDYGGAGPEGVGLRAHHAANGVTLCAGCHPSDPTPLPEDVPPPYYGSPDTNADDACNSGPAFLENWSIGDTDGLDNDGDNAYDEADSDCGTACPGDADADQDVDLTDLAIILLNFGMPSGAQQSDGDVDGDGDVDLTDLAIVLLNFGMTC